MEGRPDKDYGFLMVVSSKKLKVNLPENNDYDGRADLAQHMVHETTHAIQQDCDDRISDIDFYNNYFKGERDKRKAVNSFNVSNDIFNDLSFDVFAIADIISSELHFNKKMLQILIKFSKIPIIKLLRKSFNSVLIALSQNSPKISAIITAENSYLNISYIMQMMK